MAELLGCPFCGEAAEIERTGDRRASTIYACTMCGCRLETGEEWGHGRQWNTRAALLTPPQSGDGAVERVAMSKFQSGANWDKARGIVKEHREYLESDTGFDLADKEHHAYEGLIARIAAALTPASLEVVASAEVEVVLRTILMRVATENERGVTHPWRQEIDALLALVRRLDAERAEWERKYMLVLRNVGDYAVIQQEDTDRLTAELATLRATAGDAVAAERDRLRAALVWIYEHGFQHSSECPQSVRDAFNDAYESVRRARAAPVTSAPRPAREE